MTAPVADPVGAATLPRRLRPFGRTRPAALLVRAWFGLLLTASCWVAAWFVARAGISYHQFPGYGTNGATVQVTNYAGQWIGGGFGLLALGGLFAVAAVSDLRQRRRDLRPVR